MNDYNIIKTIKKCFKDTLSNKLNPGQKLTELGLVTVLVLFFQGDSKSMCLENIRMAVFTFLEIKIAKSSFWERIASEGLTKLMYSLSKQLMGNLVIKSLRGAKVLKKLKLQKIVLIDSSTISLWNCVSKIFPGVWTTAGIKLHACFDLMSGKMEWFESSPSSSNDQKHFPNIGDFIKGTLFIFDLGYWDYGLLIKIDMEYSFFLSRIKSNATIIIKEIVTGISKEYIGKQLSSIVFKKNRANIIEFFSEISCNESMRTFRVFGFWNPDNKNYHWYISNLKIDAIFMYPLYRLRWQIELLFKLAKSRLNLKKLPSGNKHIINNLILANVCSYLISTSILDISIPELKEEEALSASFQRVGKIFKALAIDFINVILKSKRYIPILENKIKELASEIFDPNYHHRPGIFQKILNSS